VKRARFSLGRGGSALVESTLSLVLVTLALVSIVELVRRSWFEVTLTAAACEAARASVLGKSARKAARESLRAVLGENFARHVVHATDEEPSRWTPGAVRLYLRYPMFLSFSFGNVIRHHFEMTVPCRYPYSR
jgi:hypothetical protein